MFRSSAGSILDISKYRDTCERSISIGLMVSRYFDISNDQTILGRYIVRSGVSSHSIDMEALPENLDIAIPTTDSSIINTSD